MVVLNVPPNMEIGLRIAMITADFLPNIGGIANHIYNLSRAMRQLGHDCRVLHLTTNRRLPTKETINGLPVLRFKLPPYERIKRLTAIPTTGSVLAFLRRFCPDVVHWHELSNAWLMLRALIRAPVKVVTIHSARFIRHSRHFLGRFSNRLQLAFANAVFVPSNELHNVVLQLAPHKGVHPVSNGVDVEVFKPHSGDGKVSGGSMVLCPRRLVPKNGVEFLVEAAPRIVERFPQVRIVLAGSGRLLEKLQTRVEELGLKRTVEFLGHVPYAEIPRLYRQAAVVVMPSLVEATSLACLEAMASGCAVVASRVGGLAELIDDGVDGLLVEPANPAQIADAVCKLLADPDLRRRLGQSARQKVVKHFSWRVQARKIVNVYYKLLAEKRHENKNR